MKNQIKNRIEELERKKILLEKNDLMNTIEYWGLLQKLILVKEELARKLIKGVS